MLYILSLIMSTIASLATMVVFWGQPAPTETPESAITRADKAFCQAVIDRDVDRFRDLVAERAVFNAGTPEALSGRDAVVKGWMPFLTPDGPRLTWTPLKAEVLPVGDVGYTVGTWERRVPRPDGTPTITRGHYMTVWRKEPDGKWRAVFDSGGEDPR